MVGARDCKLSCRILWRSLSFKHLFLVVLVGFGRKQVRILILYI